MTGELAQNLNVKLTQYDRVSFALNFTNQKRRYQQVPDKGRSGLDHYRRAGESFLGESRILNF